MLYLHVWKYLKTVFDIFFIIGFDFSVHELIYLIIWLASRCYRLAQKDPCKKQHVEDLSSLFICQIRWARGSPAEGAAGSSQSPRGTETELKCRSTFKVCKHLKLLDFSHESTSFTMSAVGLGETLRVCINVSAVQSHNTIFKQVLRKWRSNTWKQWRKSEVMLSITQQIYSQHISH